MSIKAEHITASTGNIVMRDVKDIIPYTIKHFKFCEISSGGLKKDIPKTPLNIKITVENGLAIFDLNLDENLMFTTVCCFRKEDKEPAELYVKSIGALLNKGQILRMPDTHNFLYSFEVNPYCPPQIAMLCGEIEFYIWNALRRAGK